MLDKNFYPMNQDSESPESFSYNVTAIWLAEFIRQKEAQGAGTRDEILAQVEKDLRMLLDQMFMPQ